MNVEVVLGSRPEEQADADVPAKKEKPKAKIGILATDMTSEIAKAMGLPPEQKGVLILQVEAGSPADKADLRGSYKPVEINGKEIMVGGDVIVGIDDAPIDNLMQLHEWLSQAEAGQEIQIAIAHWYDFLNIEEDGQLVNHAIAFQDVIGGSVQNYYLKDLHLGES